MPLAEASQPLDQIPGNHVSFLYADGPVADHSIVQVQSPHPAAHLEVAAFVELSGGRSPRTLVSQRPAG